MPYKYYESLRHGLTAMWLNWAISFGSIVLVSAVSPFINKILLPLLVFFLAVLLSAYLRYEGNERRFECKRMVYIAVNTLMWSAAIMVIINMLHAGWFPFDWYHKPEPGEIHVIYITSLIVYPVLAIASAVALKRDQNSAFCLECRAMHGYDPDSGALTPLYSRDTRFQMRLLCRLSAFVSVVCWGYYCLYYINTNLNRPDIYFYDIFPAALFVLSLLYMVNRYTNLYSSLKASYGQQRTHRITMRFLVFRGDDIFLTPQTDILTKHQLIDTPAIAYLDTQTEVSTPRASRYFEDISAVDDYKIRFLYRNNDLIPDTVQNHYAIFLDKDANLPNDLMGGEWYSQVQLSQLIRQRLVAPALAAEIKRIYVMTLAWKTYDREGRRLYPIKHYKPTFRFRDFQDWDIDYNDLGWLSVANNNEDRPLWRLRQLWRRALHPTSR